MKLYHGTTKKGLSGISASKKIQPSGIEMPETMDVLLDRANADMKNLDYLPKSAGPSQPAALGVGIYAFASKPQAFDFTVEHYVVTIDIGDGVEVFDLDNPDSIRDLAFSLLSNDVRDAIKKKIFDSETILQYRTLCAQFAEYLVDLVDSNVALDDYPYIFAYSLWIIQQFSKENIQIVARSFGDEPKYFCIQDDSIIQDIAV